MGWRRFLTRWGERDHDGINYLTQGMGRCERGGDAIMMQTAKFIIVAVVKNDIFCPHASYITAGEALTNYWAMLEHHPGNL
jgi:hypothetical protein